ncbi:MAG: hypothetical protein IKT06_02540 [Aeriscardovia sp.]|nr:hypothetical protein [Aeriscardovia sp.]
MAKPNKKAASGPKAPWSPDLAEQAERPDPMGRRYHSGWGIAKIINWIIMALAGIVFFVIIWLPHLAIWATISVSAVFIATVLMLFILQSPKDVNPYLDENGTAV